ncbi:MAG: hypothetical protein Q9191_005523, partial [Dirinaria sp. TL-2023a]
MKSVDPGFNEPDALAVIGKASDDNDHVFHLFVRPKDPKAEQWDGARSGTRAALDIFNADESGDIDDVEDLLKPLVGDASEIHTDLISKPKTSVFARLFLSQSTKAEGLEKLFGSKKIQGLKPTMNAIRDLKSDAEIANMRRAGQASGRAFTEAMRQAWTREKDLAAFLDYRFKGNGCDTSAYVPVVAGGQNANVIHYVQNNALL